QGANFALPCPNLRSLRDCSSWGWAVTLTFAFAFLPWTLTRTLTDGRARCTVDIVSPLTQGWPRAGLLTQRRLTSFPPSVGQKTVQPAPTWRWGIADLSRGLSIHYSTNTDVDGVLEGENAIVRLKTEEVLRIIGGHVEPPIPQVEDV